MYRRLYSLCLVALIASIAAGCDEEKKSGGSPTPTSTLDLKGFQIIRPRAQQPNGQIEVKTFASDPFNQINTYQLSDQIWANNVPEGLKIKITSTCEDSKGDSREQPRIYKKVSQLDFDRPIALMEVLPEVAIFRPLDVLSSSLKCSVYAVVRDSKGNTAYLDPESTEGHRNKPVTNPNGYVYLNFFKIGEGDIQWSQEHSSIFTLEKIRDLGRLYISNTSPNFTFDNVSLECETFHLKQSIGSKVSRTDLYSLDPKLIQRRLNYSDNWTEQFLRQNCRFFAFSGERLVGLSKYFTLDGEQPAPRVRTQFVGPNFYGNGFAKAGGDSWVDTKFARTRITNTADFAMAISFDLKSITGRAQFITTIPDRPRGNGIQIHIPEHQYVKSQVYQLNPWIRNEGGFLVSSPIDPESEDESLMYRVLGAGETIELNFLIHAQNCYFWGRGNFARDVGAYGTYGVIVEPPRFDVNYYYLEDKLAGFTIENFIKLGEVESGIPRSGEFKLIRSSNDNRGNWINRYAPPQSRIRITESPSSSDDRVLADVCGREQKVFTR
jgi:hypothetical protein